MSLTAASPASAEGSVSKAESVTLRTAYSAPSTAAETARRDLHSNMRTEMNTKSPEDVVLSLTSRSESVEEETVCGFTESAYALNELEPSRGPQPWELSMRQTFRPSWLPGPQAIVSTRALRAANTVKKAGKEAKIKAEEEAAKTTIKNGGKETSDEEAKKKEQEHRKEENPGTMSYYLMILSEGLAMHICQGICLSHSAPVVAIGGAMLAGVSFFAHTWNGLYSPTEKKKSEK